MADTTTAQPPATGVACVPFNKPHFVGTEFDFIAEAIRGRHTAGDGPFTRKCNDILASLINAPRVLLTTSCTHALEMAALLLDIREGDEVIIPAFTFVSTANAFVLRGARPVFIDVRPDTFNLDERLLEEKITPRTRAIVPVHYAGVACDMKAILDIASAHGAAVVEDNAHGLFAQYGGRPLGSFGVLATQSFHETKNITCGEGGALVINDPALKERAEVIRDKGTNRSRFFRGLVDKYTWVDIGSSFPPSEILAAYLYAQLLARDEIQAARRKIWSTYAAELAPWAAKAGVQLPHVPAGSEQSFHMFYLVLRSLEERARLIEHLAKRGVSAVFHYQPLHTSEMGSRFGGRRGDCPVAEAAGDRLLRLPFFTGMTESEQEQVIEAVRSFEGIG